MFKTIAIVQAILLTAAVVHNIHLEGRLNNRDTTIFYQQQEHQEKQSVTVPLSQPNGETITPTLLPEEQEQEGENDSIVDLNDLLGGHEATLFPQNDKPINKPATTKKRGKVVADKYKGQS
jgi:hypothetical protein